MTHRSNALPLILLAAAAALVILTGLAIACRPAPPPTQSNTPTSPATATATHMPTLTSPATSAHTSTPMATATATHAPTPTATHTPAPSPTKYVREDSPFDSFLAGEVAKRKAGRPAFLGQGSSDADELIETSISTVGSLYPPEYNYPGIMRYLKEQGVTPIWAFDDTESGLIRAELTLDMIIELSEMRGVDRISTPSQQYPGMGPELSGVYSEYDAGLITAEEAVASLFGYPNGNIPVQIMIKNPADSGNTDRVLRFLKENGIIPSSWDIFRRSTLRGIPPTDAIYTSVPWSLVPRLAKLPGIEVRADPDTSVPDGPMHSLGQQPSGATNPADAHGATKPEAPHARL